MSETIKNQYQVLAELKKIDEKAARFEKEIERFPEEIARIDSRLTVSRNEYLKAKEQFDECEKKLRTAERDLKEREENIRKAEGKMMEVKTNEEYQAAIKENQNQKDAKSGLEDRVLTLLSEVEEQRTLLKGVEKEFKAFESTIVAEKKVHEDEQAKFQKTLAELSAAREQFAADLDPSTLALYRKITAQKLGVAVVDAVNGMCRGCNIHVRAQLYNEILGFKAIHRCPTCGKILIVPPRDTSGASGEDTARH